MARKTGAAMKRNITITIIALGALWVISTGVFLFFAAALVSIPWLLVAFGVMDAAFFVALALLVTAHTRPSWPADPYALDTAELLRPPLLRTEERRVTAGTVHDRSLTQRISDMVEADAALNPPSDKTPAWRIDRRTDDAPKEES